MDDPPLQRSNTQLNVCIVGAGPAGLLVAIGLAQQGHNVIVLDALPHPSVRGTVNRDRSYPVDITARGMLALSKFGLGWRPGDDEEDEKYSTKVANGMTKKNHRKRKNAMRARLLPFMGHAHWHNQPPRPGSAPGKRCAVPGLIGTRDDIVCGLLDHIETVYGKVPSPAADGKAEARPGSVRVFCGVSVEAPCSSCKVIFPPHCFFRVINMQAGDNTLVIELETMEFFDVWDVISTTEPW